MSDNDAVVEPKETGTAPGRLKFYHRGASGKSIRRQLEHRFNAVLDQLASGDPDTVGQLPFARWLLDNSHLVRQALQQLKTDLPATFHRQLPVFRIKTGRRVPRVFALIDQAIDDTGLPIDRAFIEQVCRDYRSTSDVETRLTLGELWVVPTALRITLLTRLCEAADRALKTSDAKTQSSDDNSDTTVIAGCISSIRVVSAIDWSCFVERTSVVEHILRKDPIRCYPKMDFDTRDQYRNSLEKLAAAAKAQQWEVAEAALDLARDAASKSLSEHQQHVGYYLIDKGRPALENAVAYQASSTRRLLNRLTQHRAGLYLSAVVGLALTGAVAVFLATHAQSASLAVSSTVALLTVIPLLSVSGGLVNFALSLLLKPKRLPKLELAGGITPRSETIVVVPTLLGSATSIAEDLSSLERNYLGNVDAKLQFALLSDFTDSAAAETPNDTDLLHQAVSGIDALNDRYGTTGIRPFLLFHRRRLWNENAQRWMGWERKRGKLEEFNALLRGASDTSYCLQHGADEVDFARIRYVITLDADSFMPTGTALRLIGTLAHPLNRPRFDAAGDRVLGGYTVLQPRLETNPVTGADTRFARFFASDTMLDLYTHAVSDVYQDLFAEAVYAGKGIYDVDAFTRSVADRIPENTVLSHDLLEGLMGRVALASDIVLLENYPGSYLAYLKRLHRWVRGDWQLMPWLIQRSKGGVRAFQPGLVAAWKMFDNLRRSLVSPAILALLIITWLWLPANTLLWTALFALFPGLPILLRITLALRTSQWRWGTIESSLRNLAEHAGADAARWILTLVFLPAEAWVLLDAALRTIYRVTVSHQHMLDWTTAAHVDQVLDNGSDISRFWRRLWPATATTVLTLIAIVTLNPSALSAAAPLLLLWAMSPWLAHRLSQRLAVRQSATPLTAADRRLLRGVARDTWRFFERFVGPETGWLPPDNVQEYPRRSIAERTSPTNIGMLLLSTLSAYDFGYLGHRQFLNRLANHVQGIQKLHKHGGHLFNWYSTRDRRPLNPHYVSTVDSGNFVAALITVQQALEDLPRNAHCPERNLQGVVDELYSLRNHLFADETQTEHPTTSDLIAAFDCAEQLLNSGEKPLEIIRRFEEHHCARIENALLQAVKHDPHRWSTEEVGNFRENARALRQRIDTIGSDIGRWAPWSARLLRPPVVLLNPIYHASFTSLSHFLQASTTAAAPEEALQVANEITAKLLDQVAEGANDDSRDGGVTWLRALQQDIESATGTVRELEDLRRTLVQTITDMIAATDFTFLYDPTRNLFRVGYNASIGEFDASYYDLLASEARIASFIAIAKGDVPAKHWMHLGRPLTRVRGCRILLSWSATAFEYLMPRLLMLDPPSGLLNQSCEGVVAEQIRFGHEHAIPWGVSESGYAHFDTQHHYQYFAFGIPKLGLKWDQGERLVTASYASALALPYAPAETVNNFRQLIELNANGRYGLFEAVDFGEAHKTRSARPEIVRSYMAHHQGMILVAIGNALHGDKTPKRFHRSPTIASVEYLLYEQLPQRMQTRSLEQLPSPLKELPGAVASVSHWPVQHPRSEVAILSNGQLSSRVSDQGGGALYWRGLAATRWDPLREGAVGGSRLYVKDLDRQELHCLGGANLPQQTEVLFAPHVVEFRMHQKELLLRMSIVIAPDCDTEIRKVTITNDGRSARRVQLTSYLEPCLALEEADRRHLTFSKLFIESQFFEEEEVLLFRRRPREEDQAAVYLAHCAVTEAQPHSVTEFETDRGRFLGRLADPACPVALQGAETFFSSATEGSLDTCSAIGLSLEIPAGSTIQCAFLTAVAATRKEVLAALRPVRPAERVDWTIAAARLQSEQELTEQRIDSAAVHASFELLAKMYWPQITSCNGVESLGNISRAQDTLWRHGISGDRPIITLRVCSEEDLQSAATLLKQVTYLSNKGFTIDLVFIDESVDGYNTPTTDRLRQMIEKQRSTISERAPVQVFMIGVANLSADEKTQLIAASRLYLDLRKNASRNPAGAPRSVPMTAPAFVPQPSAPLTSSPIASVKLRDDLLWRHRFGGMLPDFDGYSLLVSSRSRPPAPWCNVLANSGFGTLLSDAGSMCTWWGNSSEYRLTPWNNDPVLDKTGEAIYVRDEETGESWSMTPLSPSDDTPYRVTHGIGETSFEHNRQGLEQRLQIFVDPQEPVKYLRLRLTNRWQRTRRLTVTFAAEWLLGNTQGFSQHLLIPELDEKTDALLVRNAMARHSAKGVAFVTGSLSPHGVSCNGEEFFGQERNWAAPIGLSATGLSDQVVPNNYPCAIYQVHIDLSAEETTEFHFALGAADTRGSGIECIKSARSSDWVQQRYLAMQAHWMQRLNTWQVTTPDIGFDALANRWLLYQVMASRLWGRVGFYQASGGFGFRDQLQDVLALLDCDPDAAREHITLAASRQFEEGDVLHWWHESPLRGVRTRCSDDLLWLAYATSEYVEATCDASILNQTAPFLLGEALGEHELERYAELQIGENSASIYEHCCRAIDLRIAVGEHGLPFIGTGDWNDGENRVGENGRGESVWMAWFLIIVCRRFAPLCRDMDDPARASYYETIATGLLQHTQDTAWAEQWYLRGYFDDGTPLGAPGDSESAIDLNAQTWALIADPGDPNAQRAMRAIDEHLIDSDHQLIKLLAPPFDKTVHDPGYIRAYPPGVRENGGQYTHAAVWAAWAAAALGDQERAMRWFDWLNPLKRACTDEDVQHYRLEPYVTAGDIYGTDTLAGRGGWSWYTGSAAWMYRLAIRELLGLQRRGARLFIRPCLPESWSTYSATLRYATSVLHLHVHNPASFESDTLFIVDNGRIMDVRSVQLDDSGNEHVIEVFASDAARGRWLTENPTPTVALTI